MLDGLFRPRAVAVIGDWDDSRSTGHVVIENLARHGFNGAIFPVNSRGGHIRGYKAYRSILEVPDEVDLVSLSIDHTLIPAVVEECGKKGVKFAVVHSAGFQEAGEEGIKRERELVAIAHSYGMRILGPNSPGIQNADPAVSACVGFTLVPMKPGNVSIIAQGRGVGEMLLHHLHKAGLGHRLYCSCGNGADLTVPELLEHYGKDPGTRVIVVHVGSFKDPAAFLKAASAVTSSKPILAITTGRTREGSPAGPSRTGALVDEAVMTTAMFKKAGAAQFHDTGEMLKAAIAISTQEAPLGRRIGIITNSGGPGVQAAVEAVDQGLELAVWSEEGRELLKEGLSAEASPGNPLNIAATADADHWFAAVDTLLKEEGTDMALVIVAAAVPITDTAAVARRITEATDRSHKPVAVGALAGSGELVDTLRASSLPVYEFAEDGARALAAMSRCAELCDREVELGPELRVDRRTAEAIVGRFRGTNAFLPRAEAFALLEAYGIPLPRWSTVSSRQELAAAAVKVGFPSVLKVDSTKVADTSDAGGVALGHADLPALERALDDMGKRFTGDKVRFLLQQQRPPGLEVRIGATEAPGLGTLVMFGLGGVLVELLEDVTYAVAPLTPSEASAMIRSTRRFKVLERERGQAVDLAALADVLLRASRLAAEHPSIVEMDLNPVLVYPRGASPAAVDVRIRVR